MLQHPFGVTRDGEPISLAPLRHSVRTGISFDDPRTSVGLIAEYEEREAATHAGYTWHEWDSLDPSDRAAAVAHLRLSRQISLHSNDAVMRDSEAKSKRKGAKDGV